MGEFDAWDPEGGPPAGFAERVLAAAATKRPHAPGPSGPSLRKARVRRGIAVVALLSAAAAVALGVVTTKRRVAAGEARATDQRREVALGERAIAVLEPGALLTWTGDDVVQSDGDVFYRVATRPGGATFRVHTAAGDVSVLGTCFRVRVIDMNRRDVVSGAVGAALGAAALVSVYEGRVAASHGKDSVDVRAGEAAQLDARGAHAAGPLPADGTPGGASRPGEAAEADPMLAANQNLAGQVQAYRQQLEQNEASKKALEARLKAAEERLAVQLNDGASPRSSWDISQGEWKQLAAEGTVKARYPCSPDGTYTVHPEMLDGLGLPADDGPLIKAAYERSLQRTNDVVMAGCRQILGADLAARLGPTVCESVISSSAQGEGGAQEADMRKVALIRAGELPMPAPNDPSVDPEERVLLAQTGELKALESDLASSIGPDDAHIVAYSDQLGACSSTYSNGPTPKLPPR